MRLAMLQPQPVSLPTDRVLAIVRYFTTLDRGELEKWLSTSNAKQIAVYLLGLSPSMLLKERFDNDEEERWLQIAAALWYGRRSFEWTYERSTEGLLAGGVAHRTHTIRAAQAATRYALRDGFPPLAFLPRDSAVVECIADLPDRQLYLDWSVDYDERSGVPMGGCTHWGHSER